MLMGVFSIDVLYSLIICFVMINVINCSFDVERDHSGDQFTTICQDCRKLRARCVVATDSPTCCSKCRCYSGDTFYKTGLECSVNPSIAEGCTLRMDRYQYSGHKVPIYKLFNNNSETLGDIVKANDYDILKLRGCSIVTDASSFSSPALWEWNRLFENGRNKNDFVISTDKVKGSTSLKGKDAVAYQGMLIKFSLQCTTVSSCLLIRIHGKRSYDSPFTFVPDPSSTEQITSTPTTLATKLVSVGEQTTASPTTNTTAAAVTKSGDSMILIVIIVVVLILLAIAICFIVVLLRRRSRKSNGEAFLFSIKPLPSISKARLLSQRSLERKKKKLTEINNDEEDEYLQPMDAGVTHYHVKGDPRYNNSSQLPLAPNLPVYMETCPERDAPYATCDDPAPTNDRNQSYRNATENIYADPNAKPTQIDPSSYQALDESTLTRHSGYIPLNRSTLLRNQTPIPAEQESKHCYATIEGEKSPSDYETAQGLTGPTYHVVDPSPSTVVPKGFDALKDRPQSTEYTEIAPKL